MRARQVIAVAMALVVTATSGCGGASPRTDAPKASTAVEGKTSYPLTINNCGKDYTFAQAPSRVVVMNGGSVAEVSSLLELGVGDRIVANAQNYGASEVTGRAEAISKLPTGGVKLNNLQDIPREAMLAQRPDFVIATYAGGFAADSGFATREELLKAGANTYVPATACGATGSVTGTPSIEDSYSMLRDFGKIFDSASQAEKIISDSKAQLAALSAKLKDKPAKKVMVIFPGMGADDLASVAGNGIWNDILAKAGGVNAFAGATTEVFATISKEQAAAAQVDALVIVNYMNPDPQATATKLFKQFPQWQAAKDNRVVILSDSIYLGPSNHIAVSKIAAAIHPDAL